MGFSFVISTFHYTLTPSRRDFIHPGNACMHYSYILYVSMYFSHSSSSNGICECMHIYPVATVFLFNLHLSNIFHIWIFDEIRATLNILIRARRSIFQWKIYESAHCFYFQPCLVFTLLCDKFVEEVYLDNLSD